MNEPGEKRRRQRTLCARRSLENVTSKLILYRFFDGIYSSLSAAQAIFN